MLEDDLAPFLSFPVADYAKTLANSGMIIFMIGTALTVSSGVSYALKYRRVFDDIQQ